MSMTVPNTSTLPLPKTSAGHPVEGAPVDAQAQIAFLLRGESANRGAVEGQVLVGPEQKLLVVVQQVEAAFKVGEQDRHSLDPLLVGQIFHPLFADLHQRRADWIGQPWLPGSALQAHHTERARKLRYSVDMALLLAGSWGYSNRIGLQRHRAARIQNKGGEGRKRAHLPIFPTLD